MDRFNSPISSLRLIGILKLICLPTHFLNSNGEWLSVAEADVDPIFELANEYSITFALIAAASSSFLFVKFVCLVLQVHLFLVSRVQ